MTVYDTIISNASITDSLFSATLTQSNGLESLANAALQRGIDAYTNQDYEGAVKEFKRSVGLGRSSSFAADAAQYLAMTYLKLEDPENAIKAYKSALQVDPYRDDIRVKLGNLYFSQGKYEDARTEYAEAVRLNPTPANRYSLGQAYIELGRFSDAETQYSEIQRLAPQEAGGYLGMGLTYSRQGKHEEAIRQFEQAISRDADLLRRLRPDGLQLCGHGRHGQAPRTRWTPWKGSTRLTLRTPSAAICTRSTRPR